MSFGPTNVWLVSSSAAVIADAVGGSVGWISGTSRPSPAMINVLSPLSQTANIFCTALCQAQPPQVMFEPKLGLGPSTSVLSTKYTPIIYQVFESNKNLVA